MSTDDAGPCSPSLPLIPPASKRKQPAQYFWVWVLCLLGLDYFSTLAYQPSITFEVAGRLGPLATAVIVLVTLLGVLPVYCYLAGQSPAGYGSIGMLERFVRGWRGKTLVLVMLGFAATDFTMLKTISVADAAVHILHNDAGWQGAIHATVDWLRDHAAEHLGPEFAEVFNEQVVAAILLGMLAFLFWGMLRKGFNRNVIVLAAPLVIVYVVLNVMILGGGIAHLVQRPELVEQWLQHLRDGEWLIGHPFWSRDGWGSIALVCVLFLPNLALGLSGFEMSMILMPQVRGKANEDPPRTRIRNTRKVLIAAALLMGVLLLASSLVTTILIPPAELAPEGRASNRALAYLAHGGLLTETDTAVLPFCGAWFGGLYDLVTVLILSLAGTSVMTALAVYLPQFLLRFGMELRWVDKWGVLLALFAAVNLLVTVYFQASVAAQRNAYAGAVLVLMSCACVVVWLDRRRARRQYGGFGRLLAVGYYGLIALVFVATTAVLVIRWGGGLGIALAFILAILAMSVVSRALRADEMRTIGFEFHDDASRFLWNSLRLADFPVLVPHRPGQHPRAAKEAQIRAEHQIDPQAELVFLEIHTDDPSDFYQRPTVEVLREDTRFVVRLTGCVSVAHAIASATLELSSESKPPGVHFGWPELDLLSASWSYLAFGEGNIPWKVHDLIRRAEPDPAKRPRVIVG